MRCKDWPSRLSATLQASAGRELVWGAHDCFTHAGRVAEALTGTDPTAAIHGGYHDYASGLRRARSTFGAIGLIGLADLWWTREHRAFALRGDWAVARLPGSPGWALLIVDGGALRDARGARIPLSEARICWRVE